MAVGPGNLLSEGPYGAPEDELNGRVNGDSFVGLPDNVIYKAAGTTVAWAEFGEHPRPQDPKLQDSTGNDEMVTPPPSAKRNRSAKATDLTGRGDPLPAQDKSSTLLPKIIVQNPKPELIEEMPSSKRRKLDIASQKDLSQQSKISQSTLMPSLTTSSISKRHSANSPRETSVNHADLPPMMEMKYDGTLTVKGFQIDTIKEISPRVPQGVVLRECLEMGGCRAATNPWTDYFDYGLDIFWAWTDGLFSFCPWIKN